MGRRPSWVRGAAILTAMGLLFGCQRSPSVSPPVTERAVDVGRLRAEADARRGRGDFAGALEAYRAALRQTPNDMRLRYLTGVTLTELGRRDEAAVELRWVIDHGSADHEEVSLAQQWFAASNHGRPARTSSSASAPLAKTADPGSGGRVHGKTEWTNLDADRPVPRLQLVLIGADTASSGRRYAAVIELNQPYQFAGVPPGDYRVVGQVGMKRLWDLRVVVQEGKSTVLDLTEATSIARPDVLRARAS